VGTSFDPKEELFRNFGRIFGPLSEIVLRHEWGEGPEVKVTVAYIDPANYIAASYEILIKSDDRILSHKPEFSLPLRPGLWRVKIMYLWQDVATTGFIVLPMTHVYGKRISAVQAEDLNNGPKGNMYVANKSFVDLEPLVGLKDTPRIRLQAEGNGKLAGDQLDGFVDSLMKKQWKIAETCLASGDLGTCKRFQACNSTDWSSKSPDPKSEIFGVDEETGYLLRTR
jgi:protein xylosyltransferase